MKKLLAILLVGNLILLPSCGKKVKKESVTPSRPVCTVSTNYNGVECLAKLNYSETGVMTVEMLKPVKNMIFSINDSGCQLAFNGIELNYSSEQAKNFCPFIDLYPILKTVCYTVPVSAKTDGDSYVLKYRTPELSCTAVSDRKSGNLREIEAEDIRFVFT